MREMRSETLTQKSISCLRFGLHACFRLLLLLSAISLLGGMAVEALAQTSDLQTAPIRQLPGPLPRLVLMGAVTETNGSTQYHKIIFAIKNWDKYSTEMFLLPIGRKLPPNPCDVLKSRVVVAVYSDRGAVLSGCIPMPKPSDLGHFSVLIQKGKPVPEFVYAVINDRHTGAAYRSNLVSAWTGHTK